MSKDLKKDDDLSGQWRTIGGYLLIVFKNPNGKGYIATPTNVVTLDKEGKCKKDALYNLLEKIRGYDKQG